MKKLFLFLTTLMVCGLINAQNSTAEVIENTKETKAEKFLRESNLYREDTYIKLWEDGIIAEAKVATDLITNKKIGYCYFETEDYESLGFLDLDEIDDMILALNKILEDTKVKKDVETYSIKFSTQSGINVEFGRARNGAQKVFYSKEWYYINQYGVYKKYTLTSQPVSLKSLAKTVEMLEKAKKIINDNL